MMMILLVRMLLRVPSGGGHPWEPRDWTDRTMHHEFHLERAAGILLFEEVRRDFAGSSA